MRAHAAAALAALSLAGALTLTGCGADGQNSASDTAARPPAADSKAREGAAGSAAAPAPAGSAGSAGAAGKTDGAPVTVRPNVIRTATLGIETSDVQKTLAAARGAADGAGGYVGNESTKRGENGRMTSTVTLRVPGEHYDAVLGAMEGSGKLLHRKVEAQDVTEKVADIDSRVSSQQASVARVREMMGKATALSEVVMLESELSRRQSDLESLLAQQTALKDKTSMGTITLEVSEPAPPVVEKKKEKKEPTFLSALSGGWEIFTKILRYLLAALGALLPFLATAAVVVLLVRAYRRWRPARPKTGLTPKRLPVPAARQTPPAPATAPTAAAAPAADTEDGVRD
ncbi:DUF4349 domain-containing protein [Streptomyces sp. NRRL F-4428]|uniref:DUF4349 domain-containing protein n=1 Tax=Streptomyces sp. NRRL F-4428 TaxID=1609137 RepID=UPI0005ED327B|nr:DUF4349 domain-containing protein [Streptomyces sp. NRRL F-4428]KJK49749.1 hypothetical protein UK14_15000 [Streptomyces sp. NRRL F-4428]